MNDDVKYFVKYARSEMFQIKFLFFQTYIFIHSPILSEICFPAIYHFRHIILHMIIKKEGIIEPHMQQQTAVTVKY